MEAGLEPMRQKCLERLDRIVVKVGSAVLAGKGKLRRRAVERLVADLNTVREAGIDVVLVSSGAVASGFRKMGLAEPPRDVAYKQAAAAIGQPLLMVEYAAAFAKYKTHIGQVLLTAEDLECRPRFLNARHTLGVMLERGVLPIVNENDSVSTDEIKIGDNDHLSALVANLVSADLLVMLTNVDGIYRDGNPTNVLSVIPSGRSPLKHVDHHDKSTTGVGGMATKVEAAMLAGKWGVPTVVANGTRSGIVESIIGGSPKGTFFVPSPRKLSARKRWIAFSLRTAGRIIIDRGAARAVGAHGSSLLPSGIADVDGNFARGTQVQIVDHEGKVVARGLTTYSAAEIEQIRGRRTKDIESILGYTYGDEVVHRSDLVLLDDPNESA